MWAAIATPFDADDRFDEGVFRENVRRLHSAGVHGIYTTDSDGEFYAIEIDEFRAIIAAFSDEARKLGIATQVGVTWSNTSGMLDRLRFAADQGILGAHVGHPFYMPDDPRVLPGILGRRERGCAGTVRTNPLQHSPRTQYTEGAGLRRASERSSETGRHQARRLKASQTSPTWWRGRPS